MSSTKFVFFGPIGKTTWLPWPLIGWDIFDFSSETADWNSIKLDRKQDLNVLNQICAFQAYRGKKQDGRPGLWLAETFSTSPLKPLIGIQWNLTGSKISTSSTKFVFRVDRKKQDGRPGLWFAETFSTCPLKPLNGISTKLDRKQDLNVLFQVCVFFGPIRKAKMAALASDSLRHIRLLLRNRWTEFNETWKEARSQYPLSSLCFFFGLMGKTIWPPGFCLADIFWTSPLKLLKGIQRNLTGSKISKSSTEFLFFMPMSIQKWPPGRSVKKGGTLYSGARYVALRVSCSDRPEIHKVGRGCWVLASCQVSTNYMLLQRNSRKCLSQSKAGAAILFFRTARKHKLLLRTLISYFLSRFSKFCLTVSEKKSKMSHPIRDWVVILFFQSAGKTQTW